MLDELEFKKNRLKGTYYVYVTIDKKTYKIDSRQFERFREENKIPCKVSRIHHGEYLDGEKFYRKYNTDRL